MGRWRDLAMYCVAAVGMAGLFGAIHDQISYTVSAEYFTQFKFPQFRLTDPSLPERLRAAWVGFLASWWMGLLLGPLAALGALRHRDAGLRRQALAGSLFLMSAFALCCALTGLAYGAWQTRALDLAAYHGWYIPPGVRDLRAFLCAGYMHNAAYLGGALSIPLAWLFQARVRPRKVHPFP